MSKEELKNDVKLSIKATLSSSTVVLGLKQLTHDYYELNGSNIPYRELGYHSILDFLRAIPDTVRLSNPESPYTEVYPVVDQNSAHINKLVVSQKKNPSSKKGYGHRTHSNRNRTRGNIFFKEAPRQDDFISNDFRKDVLRILEKYPQGLSMNDFEDKVNHTTYNWCLDIPFRNVLDDISSCTYVDQHKIFLKTNSSCNNSNNNNNNDNNIIINGERGPPQGYRNPNNDLDFSASESEADYTYDTPSHHSSVSEDCPESFAEPSLTNGYCNEQKTNNHIDDLLLEKVGPQLVRNLQSLLELEENQNGIWVYDLEKKYLMQFGYQLSPRTHGFNDTWELVTSLTNVFTLKRYRAEGDTLLEDARKTASIRCEERKGNIPSTFIITLKRILSQRAYGSISTSDLPAVYKQISGKTFDLAEFGFENMDSFLQHLEEFHSDFHFTRVKDKVLIRLNSTPLDARTNVNKNGSQILPTDENVFSAFPKEVCNIQDKLPTDPLSDVLQKDQVFPVTLAEVYTPWKFFLHHSENVAILNRMMDDLNAFYMENNSEYEVLPIAVTKGLLCACRYSNDNRWHRVVIISIKLKNVKVRFVDYGTEETVNVEKLRYLHRDYSRLAQLSIRARLTGIQVKKDVDPSRKSEHSAVVNNSFYEVASACTLNAKFVKFDARADCYEVELFIISDSGEKISVADRLLEGELVCVKTEESFAEAPPLNITAPPLFNPQTIRSSDDGADAKANAKSQTRGTKQKANTGAPKDQPIPSSSPLFPPQEIPTPSPSSNKNISPPPGLSLPRGAQSQNHPELFVQPGMATASVYADPPRLSHAPAPTPSAFSQPHFGLPPMYMPATSYRAPFDHLSTMPPPLAAYNLAAASMAGPSACGPFAPYFGYPFPNPTPPPPPPPPPLSSPVYVAQQPRPPIRPPPGIPQLQRSNSRFEQPYCGGFPPGVGPCPPTYGVFVPPMAPPAAPAAAGPVPATAPTNSDTPQFPSAISESCLAAIWEQEKLEKTDGTGQGKKSKDKKKKLIRAHLTPTGGTGSVAQHVDAAGPAVDHSTSTESIRERQGVEHTLKKYFADGVTSEMLKDINAYLNWQERRASSSDAAAAAAGLNAFADDFRPSAADAAATPAPAPAAATTATTTACSASTRAACNQRPFADETETAPADDPRRRTLPQNPLVNGFESATADLYGADVGANFRFRSPAASGHAGAGDAAAFSARTAAAGSGTASEPSVLRDSSTSDNAAKTTAVSSKMKPIKQFVMQHKKN